ncbi:MAG: hypothetical protein AAB433_15385 [Nitrospirota bacterium]
MPNGAAAPAQKEDLFGIVAELEDHQKQLVLLDLTFGRLIDEIVVPYEEDEPFFIDGVPVTKSKIRRIKIIKLGEMFRNGIWELERGMTLGEHQKQKIYGEQYETRFEHILRTVADDVTAQVIKAYVQVVKPSIKDYLPKRQELISAATTVFVEAMKALTR